MNSGTRGTLQVYNYISVRPLYFVPVESIVITKFDSVLRGW